jgi:hypothetical protein
MKLDFVAVFSVCSLKYIYMFFVALSKSVIPFCRKFTSLSAWLTNLVVLLIFFSSLLKMHALPFFSLSLKRLHLVFFSTHL